MVELCESPDVPLMIAYRMHTDPAVRRTHELIEDGFLGDPVSVYGNNSQPLLETIPDTGQWQLDLDRSGYGTSVMDLGIYSINTRGSSSAGNPSRSLRAWSRATRRSPTCPTSGRPRSSASRTASGWSPRRVRTPTRTRT
nr:hypothetical protein [Halegenticoccus soli]